MGFGDAALIRCKPCTACAVVVICPQYPSAEFKANDFVLMNCTTTAAAAGEGAVPAGQCENGPDGGVFTGGAAAVMLWSTRCRDHDEYFDLAVCAGQGLRVRVTVDGSVPTPASPVYTGPIAVRQTTTISAAVEHNGAMHQLVHTATFTRLRL